jgi:cytoskeletal protein CcmA (bactofilin family)
MSLWKDNTAAKPAPSVAPTPIPAAAPTPVPSRDVRDSARVESGARPEPAPSTASATAARPAPGASTKESLIASGITIEGKIEGGGSVRIAGRFKGDVNVQGDVTIEAGAKLTGTVLADKVTIAGELEGNVERATRIDLLATGVVVGDLKARSLAVEIGATMRGRAEFGGEEGEGAKSGRHGPANGA